MWAHGHRLVPPYGLRLRPLEGSLGPRVAAAWTPGFQSGWLNRLFGDQKSVVRGGYALVFDSTGALVKDATKLAKGTQISARVARGSFTAEVKSTKND